MPTLINAETHPNQYIPDISRKFIILLFTGLIFCAQGFCQNSNDFKKLFDYDKGENIGLKQLSQKDTLQATVYEISYSSVNGLRVTASLVVPKLNLREFPAVIFLNDASQSKEAFIPQALELANHAFVSLLIEALPNRPDIYKMNYHNYTEPRKDFNAYRQAVMDIRRSVDMLEQHPKVDRNRIAFIGNGDGAMTGAIVSGIELRIQAYILMSCCTCFSCNLAANCDPSLAKAKSSLTTEQIAQYELTIKPLNPINYLPYHRNFLVFFQFAQNDPNFSEATTRELIQITKGPKIQKYYKTTNDGLLSYPETSTDQLNWLKDHL